MTYRLDIDGFLGNGRLKLIQHKFELRGGRPREAIEPLSKNQVRCVVRTKEGKTIASFMVTSNDDHFTTRQE